MGNSVCFGTRRVVSLIVGAATYKYQFQLVTRTGSDDCARGPCSTSCAALALHWMRGEPLQSGCIELLHRDGVPEFNEYIAAWRPRRPFHRRCCRTASFRKGDQRVRHVVGQSAVPGSPVASVPDSVEDIEILEPIDDVGIVICPHRSDVLVGDLHAGG